MLAVLRGFCDASAVLFPHVFQEFKILNIPSRAFICSYLCSSSSALSFSVKMRLALPAMAAMALVSLVSPTIAANPLAKLLLYITAAVADDDLLAC